jgi:hypothetical protein
VKLISIFLYPVLMIKPAQSQIFSGNDALAGKFATNTIYLAADHEVVTKRFALTPESLTMQPNRNQEMICNLSKAWAPLFIRRMLSQVTSNAPYRRQAGVKISVIIPIRVYRSTITFWDLKWRSFPRLNT